MILHKFTINNLFSYQGLWEFDLAPTGIERNVILIWGRNGYGKTSFLNSLKLLFTGVTDQFRRSVRKGGIVSRNQYLLGNGNEWMGIFNQKAKIAGATEFGVCLTWQETEGIVTVERSWRLKNNESSEKLKVSADFIEDSPLEDNGGSKDGAAHDFIQARLPESIIPFFIYDGEMVQQIAEANSDGQLRQIEQLLDLVNVDDVTTYLGNNLNQWRKSSKDANQIDINVLNREIQTLEEQLNGYTKKREGIEQEIEDKKEQIKRLDIALLASRTLALQSEEATLKEQHNKTSKELETKTHEFFEQFTKEAPLVIHWALMQNAVQELEKITQHPNKRLQDELGTIFSALPTRLLLEPPHPTTKLTSDQESFLMRKLDRIIASFRPEDTDIAGGLFHLPPDRAEALLETIAKYTTTDSQLNQWAKDLTDIIRLKREKADIERKQNDVASLAPEERRAFEERQKNKKELETELEKLNRQLGKLDKEQQDCNRKLENEIKSRKQKENEAIAAKIAEDQLYLGQRLKKALDIYRELLKALRREDIEKAINDRFKQLMDSHKQIHQIKVADNFSLQYIDSNNQPIGMSNISAGMKQLIAQALLWGLKEVSSKDAPVVVDTPLARFDRKHQENLITQYYPNAGTQVIILPTDSELDKDKYAMLQPHVYREYRLENPNGDCTQILPGGYY